MKNYQVTYPLKGYAYGTVKAHSLGEAIQKAKASEFYDIDDLDYEYDYKNAVVVDDNEQLKPIKVKERNKCK